MSTPIFWRVASLTLAILLAGTIGLVDLAVDQMNEDTYAYLALERYTRRVELVAIQTLGANQYLLAANQSLMQHIKETEGKPGQRAF